MQAGGQNEPHREIPGSLKVYLQFGVLGEGQHAPYEALNGHLLPSHIVLANGTFAVKWVFLENLFVARCTKAHVAARGDLLRATGLANHTHGLGHILGFLGENRLVVHDHLGVGEGIGQNLVLIKMSPTGVGIAYGALLVVVQDAVVAFLAQTEVHAREQLGRGLLLALDAKRPRLDGEEVKVIH